MRGRGRRARRILHRGAAAGGIHGDAVHVQPLEHLDVVARQRAGLLDVPGVQRERPAASLGLGRLHSAAFRGQHAHRGLVHVREREALHAAGEQCHAAALGSGGRRHRGHAPSHSRQRHGRRQLHHRDQPSPQTVSRAGWEPSREAPGQPAGDGQRRKRPTHARGIRYQGHQERAKEGVARGPRVPLLDARAGALDQRSVLHTRRTRRHAGQAAEAVVHVRDERRREIGAAFHARLHQIDAPAWRVHFLAPEQIRGTRGEAEAAVDARVDAGDRGAVRAGKRPCPWHV